MKGIILNLIGDAIIAERGDAAWHFLLTEGPHCTIRPRFDQAA